jgi:hypothetical protein
VVTVNYEEVKNKIYLRQGVDLGMQGDNFYIGLDDNTVYELPPAVYYVWTTLDGERTLEKTIEDSSSELQIDKQALIEPFLAILEKLLEAKLAVEKA